MQWKQSTSTPETVVPSAGKVMTSWDAKDISIIDYLQKDKTSNGEYYASLLGQLRSKQPGKLTNGVLFHHNNAPALHNKSVVTMSTVHDCEFKLIDRPPYSFDLAPSDYFLFRNTKKYLDWKRESA